MNSQFIYSQQQNPQLMRLTRPNLFVVATESTVSMIVVLGIYGLSRNPESFWQYLPMVGLPFVLLGGGRLLTLLALLVKDFNSLDLGREVNTVDLMPIKHHSHE